MSEKYLRGNVDAELWAIEFIKHVQAGTLDPTNLEDVRAPIRHLQEKPTHILPADNVRAARPTEGETK